MLKNKIFKKILEKWEKILEKSGKVREFCQSGKVGTLVMKTNVQKELLEKRNIHCHCRLYQSFWQWGKLCMEVPYCSISLWR